MPQSFPSWPSRIMHHHLVLVLLLAWSVNGITIDCDKVETVNENHIHYCCKHPDGHNEIIDNCAKETGFKLANSKEQSLVDVTATQAISGTCFAKCVFDKLQIMKDDNLDMEAVKKYLNEKFSDDPEYVKDMTSAFDRCHGKTEENTAKFMSNHVFVRMSKHFCAPKSGVIMACVIRQFFHNCATHRWSKSDECEKTLAFSQKCRDSLATM